MILKVKHSLEVAFRNTVEAILKGPTYLYCGIVEPICVSISPGGTKPPRGLKAHNAKKMAKRPKPKIQVAPKHVTPVAAHGPAKDRRIEGNPEIQRSRSIARTLPQISRSRHTNAAATMGYAAFSAVGVELASLVLVF